MSALLALFIRSLREDSRSKLSYWIRPVLACIVLAMLIMVQASASISASAPGLKLFSFVLYVNVFFVTLAGMSYFASAITEEKEEMTLGLLRMTRLNALSILLGKSTSRLCGALMMLSAQLPFTLLAVSLGGVSIGQVIAVYVSLGAYLVLIANLGLLSSVIAKRTGGAAFIAGSLLFVLFFGPFLLWGGRELLRVVGWVERAESAPFLNSFLDGWAETSVFERLDDTLLTGFADDPWCLQVGSNVALGVVCFLLAWAGFEFFCGNQKETAPARLGIGRRTSGLPIFAPGRAWKRALLWKDFFFIGGGRFAVGLRVVLYAAIGIAAWNLVERYTTGSVRLLDVASWAFPISSVVLLAEVSLIMSRVFRQERRGKTWSTLMLLPMSIQRIAYQKVLGCLAVCLPTMLVWCTSGVILLGELIRWLSAMRRDQILNESMILSTSALLLSFVVVICFLHLVAYLSLRLRWGALALAIAAFGVVFFFSSFLSVIMFQQGSPIIMLFAWTMVTIVLHIKIGQRLVYLGAED